MATIDKSGIGTGNIVQAEHITRIIDALNTTGSADIIATGSFTGSFSGDGSNITGVTAEWDGSHVGDASITGSLDVTGNVTGSAFTGSFVGDGSQLTGVISASYSVTASYAENVVADTNFANTDLTFTGNRTHDTSGNGLFISTDGNFNSSTVTDSFFGLEAGEMVLAYSSSARTIYDSDGITHAGDTTITGPLDVKSDTTITGSLKIHGPEEVQFQVYNTSGGEPSLTFDTSDPLLDIKADTIITGSLTVTPNSSIIQGTTQTIKRRTKILNNVTFTGDPQDAGAAPGDIIEIDLGLSGTNSINIELDDISTYQLGSRYEFIVVNASGSLEGLFFTASGSNTFVGTIIGATGKPIYIDHATAGTSGKGNAKPGDHITITNAGGLWAVTGFVSGAAGYKFV